MRFAEPGGRLVIATSGGSADIEALPTSEGAETIQTPIVGRDITGVGAFS